MQGEHSWKDAEGDNIVTIKNYIFVADEIESNNLYTMVCSYKIIIHASFWVSCLAYMQGLSCLYSYFLSWSK